MRRTPLRHPIILATLAVIAACWAYTWSDVVISRTLVNHGLANLAPAVRPAHQGILVGFLIVGALALVHRGWHWAVWFATSVWSLTQSGLTYIVASMAGGTTGVPLKPVRWLGELTPGSLPSSSLTALALTVVTGVVAHRGIPGTRT